MDWQTPFESEGYAIVRASVEAAFIERAFFEADRLHRRWEAGADIEPCQGVRWLTHQDDSGQMRLRGIQWVSRLSTVFDEFRTLPALHRLLVPRLGDEIVSVVETLFFKPPGEVQSGIALHRDAEFRRPATRYRDLANSYVQVGIALDPHGPENGGMVIVPGSHRRPDIDLQRDGTVIGARAPDDKVQPSEQLDLQAIRLEPGDALFWSAHLIHGSPPNASAFMNRRFYVCGFMRRAACDDGVPAYSKGEPAFIRSAADADGRAGAP